MGLCKADLTYTLASSSDDDTIDRYVQSGEEGNYTYTKVGVNNGSKNYIIANISKPTANDQSDNFGEM